MSLNPSKVAQIVRILKTPKSNKELLRETRMADSTLRRYLKELEDDGVIERTEDYPIRYVKATQSKVEPVIKRELVSEIAKALRNKELPSNPLLAFIKTMSETGADAGTLAKNLIDYGLALKELNDTIKDK